MDALIRKKKQLLLVNKRLENKRSVRTALVGTFRGEHARRSITTCRRNLSLP